MSGFRLWLNDFTVAAASASDSSGKIDNGNGTYSYTHDELGVKACLLDLCSPLMSKEDNGVGWEINTNLCPDSVPIKLVGTKDVYALFFKNDSASSDSDIVYGAHTPGRNLMIALPLTGYNSTSTPAYYNYLNPPFLRKYLCDYNRNNVNPSNSITCDDVCMSLTYTLDDVWDVTRSIQDDGFYPSNSTPILFLSSYPNPSGATQNPYSHVSLVNYGNSDTSYSGSSLHTNGPTVGSKCRYFILANEHGDIGLGASYKDKRPYIVFAGNFYDKKFNQNDNLPTSKGCYFYVNHCQGNFYNLWFYGSNATTTASYSSDPVYNYMQDFNIDGSWLNGYSTSQSSADYENYRLMYITNPSLREATASYKTAHQIITNVGSLDKNKIRAIDRTGAAIAQTYSSGQWCFISLPTGNIQDTFSPVSVRTSNDSGYSIFGAIISWDATYNNGKTFY